MAIIDIRDDDNGTDIIKFSDAIGSRAVELQKSCGDVYINSYDEITDHRQGGGHYVIINSKTDAENLIKAIQKAIELGWWNE